MIAQEERTAFSFEVLPPMKGTGLDRLRAVVDKLREFDPKYINITTHSAEYVYEERADGLMQRHAVRRRPGTVAVAAALQYEYGIPVVPHVLCQGFTREETEYVLLDLQFLGMTNILAMRGDKPKMPNLSKPLQEGEVNEHATDLIEQINDFNNGRFIEMELSRFWYELPSGPIIVGGGFNESDRHYEPRVIGIHTRFGKTDIAIGMKEIEIKTEKRIPPDQTFIYQNQHIICNISIREVHLKF